jgi:hypothetical protein
MWGSPDACSAWGTVVMREVMAEANRFEPTQFVHHGVDLLGVRSLGVENGLGVVEEL